ncbi:hypothetical protein JHK82_055059 [Glycine max]|nr:hypothetical protein JHK82_055059 [Glycine max]
MALERPVSLSSSSSPPHRVTQPAIEVRVIVANRSTCNYAAPQVWDNNSPKARYFAVFVPLVNCLRLLVNAGECREVNFANEVTKASLAVSLHGHYRSNMNNIREAFLDTVLVQFHHHFEQEEY